MTLRELLDLFAGTHLDYDVFVESPDGTEDYFLDKVRVNDTQRQVILETAE